MIELQALTKSFGHFTAIRDVSFRIDPGEVVGFLGPNGAGKTTTLRILTCFMPGTSGLARVDDIDCAEHPREVRRRIGYLAENNPLYPEMTVRRFLAFAAEAKRIPRKRRRDEIDRVLDACAAGGVADRVIGHLSKGTRQRVGLAQALVGDPPVLILDEPTIGLDPTQIIEIRSLIRGLAGNRTILLSSHILPEVSQVCGRVIIINHGEIVATDTPANLLARMGRTSRLLARVAGPEGPVRDAILRVPGVRDAALSGGAFTLEVDPERDARGAIARAIVGGGWDLLELRAADVSLEEIFVKLVTVEPSAERAGGDAARGAAA